MKTLKEIAEFLETYIIECDPEDGCQRCNEARECLASLKAKLAEVTDEDIKKWVNKHYSEYDVYDRSVMFECVRAMRNGLIKHT